MVTMKKIFRWIGFGILLIFVLIVGVRTADYIDEEREKKAELAYKTNIKWEWHDEYERVQISKKPISIYNLSECIFPSTINVKEIITFILVYIINFRNSRCHCWN